MMGGNYGLDVYSPLFYHFDSVLSVELSTAIQMFRISYLHQELTP